MDRQTVRQQALVRRFGDLPLLFEENIGQTAADVRFLARGRNSTLYLTSNGAMLTAEHLSLRLTLEGANRRPQVTGIDEQAARAHYLRGAGARDAHVNVPMYARVQYPQVYPGVDLVFHADQRQLEYDFVIAPGADPASIGLRFDGVERLAIEGEDLVLNTAAGEVRQPKPAIYQETGTGRRLVDGGYSVRDGIVGFRVDTYDRDLPLVIDPVIRYSTYLGGSGTDFATAIAVDTGGNAYLFGRTQSPNFPATAGVLDTTCGTDGACNGTPAARDIFVTKINAAGTAIVYSTFIGGSGDDSAFGGAVDSAGNVYLGGRTNSTDFPTVNPVQGAYSGAEDGLALKLNASGSALIYSTYLGGAQFEDLLAMTIDASGNAYFTGRTSSSDFPTVNPFQSFAGGTCFSRPCLDAVVVKLSASGALAFSSFLGGTGDDNSGAGTGIGVDPAGNIYIAGDTSSTDFPVLNAAQPAKNGLSDAWVARISAAGAKGWATYLGGSGGDRADDLAVDAMGNAYAVGDTGSSNFPTVSPVQPLSGGGTEGFVTKFTSAGAVAYSTYLGGSGTDYALAVEVDVAGAAYVGMQTNSTNFPVQDAVQPAYGGGPYDAAVTKISPGGSNIAYSTYLGGSAEDFLLDLAVDAGGSAYVASGSNSTNFPVTGIQTANAGDYDGVVTKLSSTFTRYFAEGATSSFFDCFFALANPSATATAGVTLRFLKTDGSVVSTSFTVGPLTRRTVDAKAILGGAEFSTLVEATGEILADRTMKWDGGGYGSHAETSIASPSLTWYLAEGATHSGFNLFYLIQNPNASPASVQVTYLRPAPAAPLTKTHIVAANSRFNIWVNNEAAGDSSLAGLAATDVSARITSNVPVLVERAMYLNSGGLTFGAGHESAGVTAPATSWFLAEGATGSYFDLFVLLMNPNAAGASATATYLLPDGTTVVKTYQVPANSRSTIWVDFEDARLANTAVSTSITSTQPIVVERAMWWPGPTSATWFEAHNTPGTTAAGVRWGMADGEVAGGIDTYILIANTSAFSGGAKVTLLFEDGTTTDRTFSLNATSRFNVSVRDEFPAAIGRRFGALVESLGATPPQIVVERAMYSNALGVTWMAGTNALGTRLQ